MTMAMILARIIVFVMVTVTWRLMGLSNHL